MNRTSRYSIPFLLSGLFDGVLGVGFILAAPELFEWLGIPPLEHYGYIHFAAALLIVFALMFMVIARAPIANRNLIPYGMLLKVSYCSVVD